MLKKEQALFPFIMGILAFVCFLVVAVVFIVGTVSPRWGSVLILLVPSFVFFGIGILAWKGIFNSKKTTVLTIILTVVLLVLSFFYVIILMFLSAEPTTETRYYERAYHQIVDEKYVKDIFPANIPEDAKDISFYYSPQFLQGGEEFRLSYIITEEKIMEWTALLQDTAEWVGSNKEWNEKNLWGFSGSDSIRYHLYWNGDYNHRIMCYVLVDPSLCKIEFIYEHW